MATCLWKSGSFGLPRVPCVNCCQFMYLVISLLGLKAGYGFWLYQFLIIAYLIYLIAITCLNQTTRRLPRKYSGISLHDIKCNDCSIQNNTRLRRIYNELEANLCSTWIKQGFWKPQYVVSQIGRFVKRHIIWPFTEWWIDELGFYVPSTVFQSFRDDGRVNVKGSVQWSAV